MDYAFCVDLGKNILASRVYLKKARHYHFKCPKCREIVIFRDWSNADPYFAHRKYNGKCPLSADRNGTLFITNYYIDSPLNRSLDDYQTPDHDETLGTSEDPDED